MEASANGPRLRFTRNVASIVMDADDVERLDVKALGGADTLTVDDLTGTDVAAAVLDLAAVGGGGDAQHDTVIANGTNGADTVEILGASGITNVVGLAALVQITDADATDSLVVNTLGGGDTVSAATLTADALRLTVDSGDGDDTIVGGRGADVLIAGADDDSVDGQQGDDLALLGGQDDEFKWDPRDGSDVVEGQDGFDRLLFNGSGVGETMDVSANGGRVRFFRNVGNITMDLDDVEALDLEALGGADTMTVNDLSGTAR